MNGNPGRKKAEPPEEAAARDTERRFGGGDKFRLVVTDSGLGGLAVLAGLERVLRSAERIPDVSLPSSSPSSSRSSFHIRPASPAQLQGNIRAASAVGIRLIYVNAWPDERFGYNDLPDAAERARVFDRALGAMERLRPDMILIACNTLSVLYELTAFSRRAAVPVRGVVETGTDLFTGALAADPGSSLVIFGTKTTIESGVHRRRLIEKGIASGRIAAVACHGLAAAIDDDAGGEETRRRIAACAAEACGGDEREVAEGASTSRSGAEHSTAARAGSDDAAGGGAGGADTAASGRGTLYAGLACTHYGWVADAFREQLEECSGRRVVILDPNERLAVTTAEELSGLIKSGGGRGSEDAAVEQGTVGDGLSRCRNKRPGTGTAGQRPFITVEVVSKVALSEEKRQAAAARLEPVSGLTASALLNYKHQPDLF